MCLQPYSRQNACAVLILYTGAWSNVDGGRGEPGSSVASTQLPVDIAAPAHDTTTAEQCTGVIVSRRNGHSGSDCWDIERADNCRAASELEKVIVIH